jgi:hypothetical protein
MVILATYFVTSLLSLPHVIQLINFFCRLCHKLKVKKRTLGNIHLEVLGMHLEHEKCPWEQQMENPKMLKRCSLVWIGFRTF